MYAFTEQHNDYPAFVNLTEQPDGTMKLTVRTRGNGGRDCASINLAPAQAEELAEAIFKHVYAGESEVATPPAQDAGTGDAKDAERWRWFCQHGFFWRGKHCLQTCWPRHGEIGAANPSIGKAVIINAEIDRAIANWEGD